MDAAPATLRIAIVAGVGPPAPGGIADPSRQVARALRARGHEVDVHADPRGLPGRIAAARPHIIHLQYQAAHHVNAAAITTFGAHAKETLPGTRLVLTLLDLEGPRVVPWIPWRHGRALRALARDASGVVVTSEVDQEAVLAWGVARESVCLVPMGPAIIPSAEHLMARAAVREALGVEAGETVYVQFGLLARDKGVETTIEAARLLPPRGWRLLLAMTPRGARERRRRESLRRLADRLGVADRITWRESLAAAEVSRHLAASDVALLPYDDGLTTRRGTFAVMAAHGLPIVTTAPRIWPRLFGTESPAVLVPPRNPAALSRAMTDLLPASPAREDLRRRALACAKKLSWEECARKLEMLYRQAGEVRTP